MILLPAVFLFLPAIAEDIPTKEPEPDIILPVSAPQKIYKRYQTDFYYHHDKGFLLSLSLGPQWNHSIDKPSAKGIRFGGRLSTGWYITDGFSLFGSVWGHFLEEASIAAIGPGCAFLFDSTNIGIELAVGIGRVFNAISKEDIKEFSETVLAAELAIGKYWWVSGNSSLGLSLSSGLHGLTVSKGNVNTFGWDAGLRLAFLFG